MLVTLLKDMSFSAVTLKHMACAHRDLARLYLADPDVLEEHPKDISTNEDRATCGCIKLFSEILHWGLSFHHCLFTNWSFLWPKPNQFSWQEHHLFSQLKGVYWELLSIEPSSLYTHLSYLHGSISENVSCRISSRVLVRYPMRKIKSFIFGKALIKWIPFFVLFCFFDWLE